MDIYHSYFFYATSYVDDYDIIIIINIVNTLITIKVFYRYIYSDLLQLHGCKLSFLINISPLQYVNFLKLFVIFLFSLAMKATNAKCLRS